MSIKVNIPMYFRHYTNGLDVAEVHGTTVGECLNDLVKQFPDLAQVLWYAPDDLDDCIAVGIHQEVLTAWQEPLKQPVSDGEEFTILLFGIAGG